MRRKLGKAVGGVEGTEERTELEGAKSKVMAWLNTSKNICTPEIPSEKKPGTGRL